MIEVGCPTCRMVYQVEPGTTGLRCQICKKELPVPAGQEQPLAPPAALPPGGAPAAERSLPGPAALAPTSGEQPLASPGSPGIDFGEQRLPPPAALPAGQPPQPASPQPASPPLPAQAAPAAAIPAVAMPAHPVGGGNPPAAPQAGNPPVAQAVRVTAPATPTIGAPQIAPPHLQAGATGPSSPSVVNKSPSRLGPPSRAARRHAQMLVYGGFMLAAVVLLLTGGGVVLILKSNALTSQTASEDGAAPGKSLLPTWTPSAQPAANDWADAKDTTLSQGGVKVGIDHVDIGDVMTRDNANMVQVYNDRAYVQITIGLQNTNASPVEYRSWQTNTFADGAPPRVKLTDNAGRDYALATFPGARSVKGRLEDTAIESKGKESDTLIFQPPAGQDPLKATYFHLELPAAAHGATGGYRFHISRSMFEAAPTFGGTLGGGFAPNE